MTSKPETIAQLLRKIERLEARIEAIDKCRKIDWAGNREYAHRAVDADMKIKQAMRILSGEDDA